MACSLPLYYPKLSRRFRKSKYITIPSKQMEKSNSSRIQSSQVKIINFYSVFYVRNFNYVINRPKVVVTCHRMAGYHGGYQGGKGGKGGTGGSGISIGGFLRWIFERRS